MWTSFMKNKQVLLKRRPSGPPAPDDFEMVERDLPPLPDDGVLRRTIYLSLDPYMRGRMSDAPSYAHPVPLGGIMVGHTVSEVIESDNPRFVEGEFVTGYDGWQSHAVSTGGELRKLDPGEAPISTALSVLGMPGMTAYVGLLDIGQPRPGETVVVSSAAGAVGSIVGQIARIKGCRAVGIAGSPRKCDYVVRELGFDACVDYKNASFLAALTGACPAGIDVYFENVGGAVLAAVLTLLNQNARIPLCGLISDYNAPILPPGPNLRPLLVKRAMVKGFIISDHADRAPAFLRDCTEWVRDGTLKYREDIVEGLEAAPAALLQLFEGKNFGKLLVRVSPDPTR
jgi:NADPH-dependent curcumin reductase CurA